MVVTTGAINRAKLRSNHHHQQTNTQFYRPDALLVTQTTVSKHWREKGKNITSMDLLTPSSTRGLPTLSLTTNSSWLPWRRVVMPLISHACKSLLWAIVSASLLAFCPAHELVLLLLLL